MNLLFPRVPCLGTALLRAIGLALAVTGLAPLSHATTVLPPEFGELVNGADYIVHAVVRNVTTEKKAAVRGQKIYTHVELDVVEVIAGTPPPEITLQFLGGRVGKEELVVEGMPVFHPGDEDILFVRGNGRTVCPLYGMMHGRYRVLSDAATGGKYIARSNRVPLRITAEISLPVATGAVAERQSQRISPSSALTPAAFAGQIRASLTANARAFQHVP